MKKTLSILLVLALMLTAFTACKSDSDKIVGTWKYTKTVLSVVTEHKIIFNEDGTGKIPGEIGLLNLDMTYKIEDDKLTIKTDIYGEKVYTFSFEKDKLTLVDADGTSTVLTKAEEPVSK